ncbi:holin [Blastococcus sp. PRF04-17]|uniref:holin n=1 Tax=Blastococcus sp. PRF04-17 TaxID=2933797 RepID=UPI001FF5CB8C|nr:holin [Blastococcus sp. PRF04-17]UOY03376.1 holin [Blastococcus sp. PRF04-17]
MTVHSLFSRKFWIATAERAIRSFAASLASLLTASGTGLLETSWGEKVSVAGMAALVSILLAIGGGTFGKGDGPSFIGEEKLANGDRVAPAPATGEAPKPEPAAVVPPPAGPPEAERVPDKPVV